MDLQGHWNGVYRTKSSQEASWFQPHLQPSVEWILDAVPDRSASIIDVGGGESTLVDDLLASQYCAITVQDIAEVAIRKSRDRLGSAAASVCWLEGDVTQISLPPHSYDLWHDRALFHFFIDPQQRSAYMHKLTFALKPDGHVVIATFGPEGPGWCSGLITRQYDAESLQRELGAQFSLVRSSLVDHWTPFGIAQQFLYCHFALG